MPTSMYFILAAFAVVFVWSRLRLRSGLATHADKELGAVATKLGMQVVEGDPKTNLLLFQQPAGVYARAFRLKGQAEGVELAFTIADSAERASWVSKRITSSFSCALEATGSSDVPAFEVVLRKPNEYMVASIVLGDRNLPIISTGDAALDAAYVVRAADSRVGPLLVPALQALSGQLFAHLAGDGRRVWTAFTRGGLSCFAMAPEAYQRAVVLAARGLR